MSQPNLSLKDTLKSLLMRWRGLLSAAGQPPAVIYWQRNEATQPDQHEVPLTS